MELVDRAGMRNCDLNAGLKYGGGQHEDQQKDEDDVDERGDVNLGKRGLGAGSATALFYTLLTPRNQTR